MAPNALLLPLLLAPQASPPCTLDGSPVATCCIREAVASGDTLVVTTTNNRVRMFGEADGVWEQQAELVLTNPGRSVALSGDTVLVGQWTNDDRGADAGAVDVFVRDGTAWSRQVRLYLSDPAPLDNFGTAVAIEGDMALIGAKGRDGRGSVFVFERTDDVWAQGEEIVLDETAPPAGLLGARIALSGDTALFGLEESSAGGHVLVYAASGGTWTPQADLGPGYRFALSGDDAIIAVVDVGVRVLSREGTEWTEEAVLPAVDGYSAVAIAGDVAVTGRWPASVFVRRGASWSLLAQLRNLDAETFGAGFVAVDGERLFALEGGEDDLLQFELPTYVVPTVTHRNAAGNPDSYSAEPVYIGQLLRMRVDLTTTGHTFALVVGSDSPVEIPLGGGQTLLCLDLLGPGGRLMSSGFHPGPVAEIELPVPNDISLGDFRIYTQALHVFGALPFALSNAQDLTIGACY